MTHNNRSALTMVLLFGVPLVGDDSGPLWARAVNGLQVEGREQRSQADQIATIVNTVDLNYFETAGVAIASGPIATTR